MASVEVRLVADSEPLPQTAEIPWISPPPVFILTGDELIAGTASAVKDFWAWGMSNLRTNTLRSMLAEYLVACAVGAQASPRIEWDAFDVQIPEGRIEVKASAYLHNRPKLERRKSGSRIAPRFGGSYATHVR